MKKFFCEKCPLKEQITNQTDSIDQKFIRCYQVNRAGSQKEMLEGNSDQASTLESIIKVEREEFQEQSKSKSNAAEYEIESIIKVEPAKFETVQYQLQLYQQFELSEVQKLKS